MASRSLTLLICFLSLDLFHLGWCLQCFECVDTPKPFECDTVTTCPKYQECIVRQKITSGGLVLYDSGCASVQECASTRKREADDNDFVPEAQSDVVTCVECCNNTDFCNVQGCGVKDLNRTQRGPYCFTCHVQSDKDTCRTVSQCAVGKVCKIEDISKNGLQEFRTECVSTNHCNGIVQERAARAAEVDRCPKCCNGDFCNNDCTQDPSSVTVDGGYTEWAAWGPCSATCGDYAFQQRSRSCTNPAPQNGGTDCVGSDTEPRYCSSGPCSAPVNGGFTAWTTWNSCSTTCGHGINQRTRTCTAPAPAQGGADCTGQKMEFRECLHPSPCVTASSHPVDGRFTHWSSWSKCSDTCGNGYRQATRACSNPAPADGGAPCYGSYIKFDDCSNTVSCHSHAAPGPWTWWHHCSASCGHHGVQQRTRRCHGDRHCSSIENQSCNRFVCPDSCHRSPRYMSGPKVGVCWMLHTEKRTWQQARDRCVHDRADLAIIDNAAKDATLFSLLYNHFTQETHAVGVWIGLHGESTHWRWAHNDQKVYNGQGYNNFFNGSHEFLTDHRRDCGMHVILPAHAQNHGHVNHTWIERDCSHKAFFVCEKFLDHW